MSQKATGSLSCKRITWNPKQTAGTTKKLKELHWLYLARSSAGRDQLGSPSASGVCGVTPVVNYTWSASLIVLIRASLLVPFGKRRNKDIFFRKPFLQREWAGACLKEEGVGGAVDGSSGLCKRASLSLNYSHTFVAVHVSSISMTC